MTPAEKPAIQPEELLSEDDWSQLLDAIVTGSVVPVVGPSMVTVENPVTGLAVPLYRHLAPQLAAQLGLGEPERFSSLGDVAKAYVRQPGKSSTAIYARLMRLFRELSAPPSAPLLALAGITHFDLYLSTTADPLLARALEAARSDFLAQDHVIRFVPNGHSGLSCDLPQRFQGPVLHHLLGDYTSKDFAIGDEDYMEFICALIEKREQLTHLFRVLRERSLLLLGAPAEDWIVRFLLRAARGQRLSDLRRKDYVADHGHSLGEPLMLFLEADTKFAQVIRGSPPHFAVELEARWREREGAELSAEAFVQRMPAQPRRRAVFLSYATEDLSMAVKLARGLLSAGVPIWMDRERLAGKAGIEYDVTLESAIKHDCSFFLSLITPNTERDTQRSRYFHRERDWAAARHSPGVTFYLPVAADLPESGPGSWPEREPAVIRFRGEADADGNRPLQLHRLADAGLKPLAMHVRALWDELTRSGRQPRG